MDPDELEKPPAEGGSWLNKYISDWDVPQTGLAPGHAKTEDYDWNFLCTPRVPCSEPKKVPPMPYPLSLHPFPHLRALGFALGPRERAWLGVELAVVVLRHAGFFSAGLGPRTLSGLHSVCSCVLSLRTCEGLTPAPVSAGAAILRRWVSAVMGRRNGESWRLCAYFANLLCAFSCELFYHLQLRDDGG